MNPQTIAANAFLQRLAAQQRRLAARGRDLKPVTALTPAQFNRRISAKMPPRVEELPLADQLLRNERTRALVSNRLDRLTPEQRERSLPAISMAYEDYLRQARRADEAARIRRGQMMSEAAVPLAAALGTGGVMMAGYRPEEEAEPEPRTLDDIAVLGASALAMDPADAMPLDEIDLGDFPLVEPEVYFDEGDVDIEGLNEMLRESPAPVLPDIADLLDEPAGLELYGPSEPEEYDPISTQFTSDPDDYLDLVTLQQPVLPMIEGPDLDLPVEPPMVDLPDADLPSIEESLAPPARRPVQSPDRDPYMTAAQKRTVQALMNAGIPSGRAGMIARGEASLSPAEYRMVTGGRR